MNTCQLLPSEGAVEESNNALPANVFRHCEDGVAVAPTIGLFSWAIVKTAEKNKGV